MLAAVDDTFTSWIDVATGRPLRFAVDEYETNSRINIEHTVAELALREGDVVPVTFHLNDAPPAPEPQTVHLPDVWDYNAFLIALRSWEGPARHHDRRSRCFAAAGCGASTSRSRGKEKLTTELGELPALRFEAHTYKLDRDGTQDAERRRPRLHGVDQRRRRPRPAQGQRAHRLRRRHDGDRRLPARHRPSSALSQR